MRVEGANGRDMYRDGAEVSLRYCGEGQHGGLFQGRVLFKDYEKVLGTWVRDKIM